MWLFFRCSALELRFFCHTLARLFAFGKWPFVLTFPRLSDLEIFTESLAEQNVFFDSKTIFIFALWHKKSVLGGRPFFRPAQPFWWEDHHLVSPRGLEEMQTSFKGGECGGGDGVAHQEPRAWCWTSHISHGQGSWLHLPPPEAGLRPLGWVEDTSSSWRCSLESRAAALQMCTIFMLWELEALSTVCSFAVKLWIREMLGVFKKFSEVPGDSGPQGGCVTVHQPAEWCAVTKTCAVLGCIQLAQGPTSPWWA